MVGSWSNRPRIGIDASTVFGKFFLDFGIQFFFSVPFWLKLPSRLKILVANGTSVLSTHLDQVPARGVGWPVVYFFGLTCL